MDKTPKSLSELVIVEGFLVEDVLSKNRAIYLPPKQISLNARAIEIGYSSELLLKVVPNRDIPIKWLVFKGNSPVIAGNRINAKIPRYEEQPSTAFVFGPYGIKAPKYFDRPYKTREEAIEIAILGNSGKIIRVDQSSDYEKFLKRG